MEVTSVNDSFDVLLAEAEKYAKVPKVVVKIPMFKDGKGLRLAKALREKEIETNLTCCVTTAQLVAAGEADSTYVSFFYNRCIDALNKLGMPACRSIALEALTDARLIFKNQDYDTYIIGGSIRHVWDVTDLLKFGCDIVTVPPAILMQMCEHWKTEETIKEFDEAWQKVKEK